MMGESILVNKDRGIATIYLNEPETLNALSMNLKYQLLDTLNEIERDNHINVVIIAGKGKAFCAGGDVKAMARDEYDPIVIKRNLEVSTSIIDKIRKMRKITIAAIHGYAAGAGLSLALSSDLIVAEEETKLILSFKNVGLTPDLGIHYHLPRIVGEWKAKEWIFKGMKLSVEEAVNYGFLIDVVPKGQSQEKAFELASELAAGPLQAFIQSKLLINSGSNLKLEDIMEKENDLHTILRATNDHKEGINAFFERRTARFSGR